MNEQFWINVVVYGVTLLLASLRFGFLVGRIESNCATKAELKDKVKERDEKIATVYSRIDEHRRDCVETYVRRDMCGQMHQYTKDEVAKISEEHKEFRHEIAATNTKIFLILDTLKSDLSEVKAFIFKK